MSCLCCNDIIISRKSRMNVVREVCKRYKGDGEFLDNNVIKYVLNVSPTE